MVAASPGRPTELVLRAFVDFADQCGLAVFTRIFPLAFGLLATVAAMGRERSVANVSSRESASTTRIRFLIFKLWKFAALS